MIGVMAEGMYCPHPVFYQMYILIFLTEGNLKLRYMMLIITIVSFKDT